MGVIKKKTSAYNESWIIAMDFFSKSKMHALTGRILFEKQEL